MNRLSVGGALLLLLLPTTLPTRPEIAVPVGPRLDLQVLRGIIGRDSTLAATLEGALSPASIHRLVEAARPVHDLARVSVGHPYGLAVGPGGLLAAFTYGIDELRTLRVAREGSDLKAELLERRYDRRIETVAGVIRSSLFETIAEIGESDQLALELSEIFAWDVDFNTEIREGDSFRVAVEKLSLGGRFCRYGRILVAEFVRGSRTLQAIQFESRRGPGYFAPDGTPMRKAFLRSPLRFSRISSRFSHRRLHPILKTVRPHLGVDYAAPVGTPVHAAADGAVIQAGWAGNYGKAVRMRHANGYQTLYGHLSRIDVRSGQRVTQGARLGAVGSTGLSSGPHLDYRMTRNGAFVDPLRVQSPPAEPLAEDELRLFRAACPRWLELLPPAAAIRSTDTAF